MAEYLASQVSTLKIVIKSDNDRTFEGYATVEVVDKEGEITVTVSYTHLTLPTKA